MTEWRDVPKGLPTSSLHILQVSEAESQRITSYACLSALPQSYTNDGAAAPTKSRLCWLSSDSNLLCIVAAMFDCAQLHPGPNTLLISCTSFAFINTALSSERATMPEMQCWLQNLQTQISPFQSTLRANDRVERGTKRIAYLFSPHSASFRG